MNFERLLELILTNMDEGIIVTDACANITFYKEPTTNYGGVDPKIIVGKNVIEAFPDLTPETSTLYNAIKNRKPSSNQIIHYTNLHGKKLSMVASTFPIFENDELVGCFEIFKDLTEVMNMSEKIMLLQEQLYQQKSGKNKHNENGVRYSFESIIGKSDAIRALKNKARKIAGSDSPVLVYGETGTGKELLVQAIHNANPKRRNKPFIAQNCAALPFNLLESILFGTASGSFTGAKDNPGIFELSDGGTLFLDEINSLDIELQAKLLRVLQDGVIRRIGDTKTKSVDVRIIASTNVDPIKLVREKQLREDLYYRLNVIYLEIPPLRDRKEDIGLLINYFIEKNNNKMNKSVKGVSGEAMRDLVNYPWPGNIRELEHHIESVMNLTENDIITRDDIQYYLNKRIVLINEQVQANDFSNDSVDLTQAISQFEKELILKSLKAANGNISKAARSLNVPKQTLHNKIKKYQIKLTVDIG